MRGLARGLLVSLAVHVMIGAAVYAIPVDRFSKPETISLDFTLLGQEEVPYAFQSGAGLMRASRLEGKEERQTRISRKKEDSQNTAKNDVRSAGRQPGQIAPAADPVQSDHYLAAEPADSRDGAPGSLSSPDGVPVADKPGSASVKGGADEATQVASLGRSGFSDTPGEASGGGQGAILREIRDGIMKNVVYPDRARRMGWEGRVIVSFTVYEDGSIRDSRIVQSSGMLALDDAAQEAVRKSTLRTRFTKKIQVMLPIDYKLK